MHRLALLCLLAAPAVVAAAVLSAPIELIDLRRHGSAPSPPVVPLTDENLARLTLPEGFHVQRFAEGLAMPRMLAVADDGTVFVTLPGAGEVVALRDEDGDGVADRRWTAVKLPGVHGLAVRGTRLYLATERELHEAEIPARGRTAVTRRRLFDLPPGGRHPDRTLATGPDGRLYVTIGSTCNCCLEDHPESATILQVDLATWERRVFARGLRNTLGVDWHPVTGEMWGLDGGAAGLGDDIPPEELNRLEDGRDYGWPFVWGDRQTIPWSTHPAVGDLATHAATTTPPALLLPAHTEPLQLVFYDAKQFPGAYRDDAFATLHGPAPQGQAVVRIVFDDRGRPERVEPFLTGFRAAEGGPSCGRPCGLAVAGDGALLVGDDANGVILRVWYDEDRLAPY
jgi:glucose/arabinose dehydrogenase